MRSLKSDLTVFGTLGFVGMAFAKLLMPSRRVGGSGGVRRLGAGKNTEAFRQKQRKRDSPPNKKEEKKEHKAPQEQKNRGVRDLFERNLDPQSTVHLGGGSPSLTHIPGTGGAHFAFVNGADRSS